MENYFAKLNAVNVNDKTEKKGNLTYLSWAWAWGEVKKQFPDATYTVYENKDGWIYHTDGKTCWVKTGVTVNGIEHIEYLPVMDFKNNSIPLEKVTSYEVNKTIQRSLTKACARHGLGLYIYAGEDLPECEDKQEQKPAKEEQKPAEKPAEKPAPVKIKLTPMWVSELEALIARADVDEAIILSGFQVASLDDITEKQAMSLKKSLQRKIMERKNNGTEGQTA
jgi:hypothetical protein